MSADAADGGKAVTLSELPRDATLEQVAEIVERDGRCLAFGHHESKPLWVVCLTDLRTQLFGKGHSPNFRCVLVFAECALERRLVEYSEESRVVNA